MIGCGFIGTLISEHIVSGEVPVNLRVVLDKHDEKVKRIQAMFTEQPAAAVGIEDITSSDVDLIIEAASIGAVRSFSAEILASGKDMMIMSVGAFADDGLLKKVEDLCIRHGRTVYLPSGAVGALDAISSASLQGLDEVELTTIKNPRSLEGAAYIVNKGIDLSRIRKREIIFRGNAAEAIKGFPANVNVAISLSLAGLGTQMTKVTVIADPGVMRNIHEIRAKGDFGELKFRTENHPSPDNPKTSLLAALSAIAMLKKITGPVKIG